MSLQTIYLCCAGIGFIWIVSTAALGFIGSGGSSGDGDAGGVDADAGGDLGGVDADAGGDLGGVDADAGGDPGGADADMSGDLSNLPAHANATFKAGLMSSRRKKLSPVMLALKLSSPSTITTFAFFFGLAGYLLAVYLPFMGLWSLPLAILGGVVGYNWTSQFTSMLVDRMHASTSFTGEQMIGRMAEVTVSIEGSKLGEVTYSAHGVRQTAPARAADATSKFKAGSQVMLADLKDGIYYVEPWLYDVEASDLAGQ